MSLQLLGAPLKAKIQDEIKQIVSDLSREGVIPSLAIVDAANDDASACYARMKMRLADKLGIKNQLYQIPPEATTDSQQFLALLQKLGQDPGVHGIFIERPLPEALNTLEWAAMVPPQKDVEGEHPINIGKLFLGLESLTPAYAPATALACLEMLKFYNIEMRGKHAVVIGRSTTVGKPLAWLLTGEDATVTVCHSKTADLAYHTRQADILAVACGHPHLITADMVNEKAVVLDIGVNYDNCGNIVGDVDYQNVAPKVKAITPPVGGLGPVTVSLLLRNVAWAARGSLNKHPDLLFQI